jgi:hypothetical protein
MAKMFRRSVPVSLDQSNVIIRTRDFSLLFFMAWVDAYGLGTTTDGGCVGRNSDGYIFRIFLDVGWKCKDLIYQILLVFRRMTVRQ